MTAEQQEPDSSARNLPDDRQTHAHKPAFDNEPATERLHPTAEVSSLRKALAPLEKEVAIAIRVTQTQEFYRSVPELLDKAADYFSALMLDIPSPEDFCEDIDAVVLIERHGTVKRALADLVELGGVLREHIAGLCSEAELDTEALASLYDEAVLPWLDEFSGCIESILLFERDLGDLLSDLEDEAEEEAEEEDEEDEFPDTETEEDDLLTASGSIRAHEEPVSEAMAEQQAIAEHYITESEGLQAELLDASLPCRLLISRAEGLRITSLFDTAAVDVNTALLELVRVQGIPVEFSEQSPRAPINASEFKFCCQHISKIIRQEVAEALLQELSKRAKIGELYSGEAGVQTRKSTTQFLLTQYPLRVVVSDQGAVFFTQLIPEVLNEVWPTHIEGIQKRLETVSALLAARGHSIRFGYDDDLHSFSVRVDLQHAVEMPATFTAAYCNEQQKHIIDIQSLYGSNGNTTLVALPRFVSNQHSEGIYTLAMEAAATPLLGSVRTFETLLKQIDRLTLEIPGIVRAGITSGITGEGTPDHVVTEAYDNNGAVTIRLFSADSFIATAIINPESNSFNAAYLKDWILKLPSDPFEEALALQRPFPVVPPYFAHSPEGKFIVLDEALSASRVVRQSLASLASAGALRVTVSRDYFSDYDGFVPRVELVESMLTELALLQERTAHPAYAGVSLEWFGGSGLNGITGFKSGMLARLWDTDGNVIAQGLHDGHNDVSSYLTVTNPALLAKAQAALDAFVQLPLKPGTSIKQLTEDLQSVGLIVDDFFLQTALWHLRQDTMTTGSSIVTPREAVARMFRLPHIIVESQDPMLLLRRVQPGDYWKL